MQGIFKQMRCLFCLVLAVALLVTSGSVVSFAAKGEAANEAEAAEGYTLVAESDSIAMYAEMEEGHFYLENKKSGDKWYSVPQGLDEDEITKRKEKVAYKSELIIDYGINEGFAAGGLGQNAFLCHFTQQVLQGLVDAVIELAAARFVQTDGEFQFSDDPLVVGVGHGNAVKFFKGHTESVLVTNLFPVAADSGLQFDKIRPKIHGHSSRKLYVLDNFIVPSIGPKVKEDFVNPRPGNGKKALHFSADLSIIN